jgi:hypothetical protein
MPLLDKKGGIMPKLTPEQILDIINKAQDALAQGDHEEHLRLARFIPMPAHIAEIAKDFFGADYLLNGGFDLSEAEAEYGKDWLTK